MRVQVGLDKRLDHGFRQGLAFKQDRSRSQGRRSQFAGKFFGHFFHVLWSPLCLALGSLLRRSIGRRSWRLCWQCGIKIDHMEAVSLRQMRHVFLAMAAQRPDEHEPQGWHGRNRWVSVCSVW